MTSSSHLICAMSLGNKATKSIKQVNGRDRFFIFLTFVKSLNIFRTTKSIQFKYYITPKIHVSINSASGL